MSSKSWIQKFALVFGLISVPFSLMALTLGLMVAGDDHSGLAIMGAMIVHPLAAFLYYRNSKWSILWLATLLLFGCASVIDSIQVRKDRQKYLAEQGKECAKIAEECRPEYENAYSWWICPDSSSFESTTYLACSEFH